jgi:hypothetical protein
MEFIVNNPRGGQGGFDRIDIGFPHIDTHGLDLLKAYLLVQFAQKLFGITLFAARANIQNLPGLRTAHNHYIVMTPAKGFFRQC